MNPCTLQKNKAIGAHRGFAETFNWLVRCFKNLTGGQGCKVQWVTDDTPVINIDTYDTVEDYNTDPGGGEVTVTGTDGSTYTGSNFTFASANNSNVTVTVDSTGNLTVGVYYV